MPTFRLSIRSCFDGESKFSFGVVSESDGLIAGRICLEASVAILEIALSVFIDVIGVATICECSDCRTYDALFFLRRFSANTAVVVELLCEDCERRGSCKSVSLENAESCVLKNSVRKIKIQKTPTIKNSFFF